MPAERRPGMDHEHYVRVSEVLEALNDLLAPHIFPDEGDGSDPRKCPSCETGRLSLKLGKFGAFIGCSNYPECRFTRQLASPGDEETGREAGEGTEGTRVIGTDPESGLEVSVRTGRFGPYLQLGEARGDQKPRRSNIPRGFDPESIDLDTALLLLALPRDLGAHPESGKSITAGIGVSHTKTFVSVGTLTGLAMTALEKAQQAGGNSVHLEMGEPELGKARD